MELSDSRGVGKSNAINEFYFLDNETESSSYQGNVASAQQILVVYVAIKEPVSFWQRFRDLMRTIEEQYRSDGSDATRE